MIHSYEDLMIDSPEDIVDNLIKMFNKYKIIFPDQKLQSISREGDDVMGFKEFMVANHLSVRFLLDLCDSPFLPLQSSGKERDKLRWQFLIYDKDGSGSLTRDEMTSMFLMMYQDPDLDKAEQKIAAREITGKAEEMFSKLDADGEQ